MCTIFRKLIIFCYERENAKKNEFIEEKDNNCLLREKHNILNLLKR